MKDRTHPAALGRSSRRRILAIVFAAAMSPPLLATAQTVEENTNIVLGQDALNANPPGRQNVAIGVGSLSDMGSAGLNGVIGIGANAGRFATVDDLNSVSMFIGYQAGQSSTFSDAMAIGARAGYSSDVTGSLVVGAYAGANASLNRSVAIGPDAANFSDQYASTIVGVMAGYNAVGTDNNYFGLEAGEDIQGGGNTLIGSRVAAQGSRNSNGRFDLTNAVAVGNASAVSTYGVALGALASARNNGDVALGSMSVTSTAVSTRSGIINGKTYTFAGATPLSTVSIGAVGSERTLTNVAAGRLSLTSTDGVNGSQLFATNQAVDQQGAEIAALDTRVTTVEGNITNLQGDVANLQGDVTAIQGDITNLQGDVTNLTTNISNGTAGVVQRSTNANETVLTELGGTADAPGTAQTLTNLAAGELSATSTDAVNGSQLHATNTKVDQQGAEIASLDTRVTTVEGNITNLQGDVANLKGDVTTIQGDITNLTTNISNGTAGVVQRSTNANETVLTELGGTADAPGTAQTLTNLAAGELSATSTDAVNGSQLHATNTKVDQQGAEIAALDTRVTTTEGNITNLQGDVTTMQGDVENLTTTVTEQAGQMSELDASAVKYDRSSDGSVNHDKVTMAGTGGTTISNVAAGVADMDAVNVAQLREAVDGLAGNDLAVEYVADATGNPTNTVALTGDGTGSAVTITNVAAGTNDTDAVNYGQIKNQVAYDVDANGVRQDTITLSGSVDGPVRITNVAAGTNDTDAVNYGQLKAIETAANGYTDTRVDALKDYTDARLDSLSGSIRTVQQEARTGIASVMAAAQLRYADRPGVVSVAGGFGGYKGATSFAAGVGWTSEDLKWKVNGSVGLSLNDGDATWGVGASYAFD